MTPKAHFAIVSNVNELRFSDIVAIAAALQIQCDRDVRPIWGREAEVIAVENEIDIPQHFWPVFIRDGLDQPGALGYHTDELNQPQAFVDWQGGDISKICMTCSHEIIETICDFSGNRLVSSFHPFTNAPCRILCEPCDPTEELGYPINGLMCSDWYYPEYFDKDKTKGIKYTHLNGLSAPRTIREGGYMTFVDANGRAWQMTWFRGDKPIVEGPFDWDFSTTSLRETVDKMTRIRRAA